MFTKPIYSMQLTSETANRLFSNVNASGALDSTFLATMRVILRSRLQEEQSARLVCKALHFSMQEIESVSTSQAMGWFMPGETQYSMPSEHTVIIVYTTNKDSGAKMLELVRANCGKSKRYMSGYALQEDLRIFYARKLNALFYHDSDENNTIIFTDKLEIKQFHSLQVMLPKYFPNLFKDSPLTESETALLKSSGNKSAVEYESLIEKFTKDLDIRAEIIRSKLAGFETSFERIRLDEISDEIENCEEEYESHLETLRNLSAQIQEKKITLAGLEFAISEHSGDSELMEYFMCNKNLSIIKVIGTAIEFVVHGYADIYDTEAFGQYVGNYRGYFYNRINPAISNPQMKKLYNSIFSEGLYKLRICAAYTADIRHGLRAMKNYPFQSESDTYLPNPHIQHHACIGTYATRFQEYMKKRDYVGAIDQAVVSARNINFYDSTVISKFANDLSNAKIKCIEKSDGNLLTPLEAIKELEVNPCQNQ